MITLQRGYIFIINIRKNHFKRVLGTRTGTHFMVSGLDLMTRIHKLKRGYITDVTSPVFSNPEVFQSFGAGCPRY